jgi:DNA-binding XRE family transcriptional regulator
MDFPLWADTPQHRLRFALRLAALHHNEDGSLVFLADAIGVTKHAFYSALERGYTTPQMAISLELLLGEKIAPRENFCPATITE